MEIQRKPFRKQKWKYTIPKVIDKCVATSRVKIRKLSNKYTSNKQRHSQRNHKKSKYKKRKVKTVTQEIEARNSIKWLILVRIYILKIKAKSANLYL